MLRLKNTKVYNMNARYCTGKMLLYKSVNKACDYDNVKCSLSTDVKLMLYIMIRKIY